MTRFLLRRLAWFALTLACVVTLSFALMKSVKGGPFDSERSASGAVEEALNARYHLDWPLWKQLAHYAGPFNLDERRSTVFGGDGSDVFGGVLAGDFGPSFQYRDATVNDLIAQALPISMALGACALVLALCIGVPAGIGAALARGSKLDLALRVAATLGIAVPSFVLASLLVLVFVFLIPLFPVAGYGTWKHLVLPSVALGLPFAAYVARLVRTGLVEALQADHVRTARAKGLPEHVVVLRHALRGALLPLVSWLGPATAGILTGSLVVERVFAIPGLGTHFVNGALNRDYTVAMGVTIVYTVLVYALNLLVDVAYAALDPRIALEDGP